MEYPLGAKLMKRYADLPRIAIESHNNIPALRQNPNSAFPEMKNHLILGVRKTHRYVENHKISDFLVPYTSSGCGAMCLYCYLVCNYNKCAYLRVFVNREEMMERLLKAANKPGPAQTFEIGSNSDLVLENAITENLPWTIETFAKAKKGSITFPTKFARVGPLLHLAHAGRTIFRMSVNPAPIIGMAERGTSPLSMRIRALNEMCDAGYPVGVLIAPVILLPDWKMLYGELIHLLSDGLSERVKKKGFLEIIFMTYGFVQDAINREAFPDAPRLLDRALMSGRGRGKYCYKEPFRADGEAFLRAELAKKLPDMRIAYVV